MELTLKEKFILLAYHPEKGTKLADNFMGYGIGGAILFELAAKKQISIDKKRIRLTDTHRTGDNILDLVIVMLQKPSKGYRIKALISKIANRPSKFKKQIVKELIRKKYLREVRKKFLFIPYKRYPSAKSSYRKGLVDDIRNLVLRNETSGDDIIMLTGLAGACKFSHKFFRTKDERKIAKKRIKEIIKESNIDQAIDEAIKAVQAAVFVAVTSSAVATSSS